ncbi:ParB/RepB/Spo0J family partition protein [Sphingomonas sp. MMS12-HWE2-04]|uniref:ParB/RepB/Spo0J family partition protein n=1 Tax=Sphingomonas sp. MMS12-HWE2-04 TaxID=3234199 RepID=UPI00384B71B9
MVPILLAKSAKDAIEMSLAENYYQLPMNPADECCGFKAIIEREKKSPADVAKRFGLTEKYVLGRLRLANLAEPVFLALRCGEIGIEVAKAYASIADADRQSSVFETLQASPHLARNVNEIRRQLACGAYRGSDPKAILVGREAYVKAGDCDLFSDTSTESWLDGEIVERLANEALAAAAEAMREREGFAEVRVVPATFIPWSVTSQLSEVEPEPGALDEAGLVLQAEIEAELAAIEAEAEGQEEYSEEQVARSEALNDALEALQPQAVFSPAQKSGSIAYMVLGEDGSAKLHETLYRIEEEPDGEAGGNEDGPADEDAAIVTADDDDREDEEDAGPLYSGRLRDELAMMKTELLALHIARDPIFALSLGTFIMVDEVPASAGAGCRARCGRSLRLPACRISRAIPRQPGHGPRSSKISTAAGATTTRSRRATTPFVRWKRPCALPGSAMRSRGRSRRYPMGRRAAPS